ncbi:MAG: hypothetical protein FD169_1326 [Bacillota bacterium]|nr:MAG: hypothetical protein FD169_1326 [Bacillota bacterium]MBS3950080.1 DUF512 domain-containing protein [Peptococcaceae bacterium]
MSVIADVHPRSEAYRAGLRAGMTVLRVNGREIRDIIDWKYALVNPVMRIDALDGEQQLLSRVRHDSGEDIGISFVSPTLDKLKICKNNCLFCFVKQMPPHQRESLYIKDDDFRLSLVYGSFVTLTNLIEEDFLRIEQEKISPIYVSVHTTNPRLRATIMRNPAAAKIMDQLHRLIAAGVSVHAQLVLVPGVNDGDELLRSLTTLTSLYPGVESVALVPVGLTGFRENQADICGFSKETAREVLNITTRFSTRLKRKHGVSVVYAADEFYILAEAGFPRGSYYDDYPQLENGIGISRLFIDGFRKELTLHRKPALAGPVIWVTGESSAFLLRRLQHELNMHARTWVDVLVVKNALFGGKVTVTGLLGGAEIISAIGNARISPRTRVLIPDITLRDNLFLDNISVDQIRDQFADLHIDVCPTTGADLVRKTLAERNEHQCPM